MPRVYKEATYSSHVFLLTFYPRKCSGERGAKQFSSSSPSSLLWGHHSSSYDLFLLLFLFLSHFDLEIVSVLQFIVIIHGHVLILIENWLFLPLVTSGHNSK